MANGSWVWTKREVSKRLAVLFVPSTSSANSARSYHFWVVQIYFLRGHSNTCFPKMVIWYVQFRWMTYYKFAAGQINACIERLQWERLGKLESAFWWCNCLDNWTSEQLSLQFVIFDCYNFYWPVSTEIDTTTPWKRNTHIFNLMSLDSMLFLDGALWPVNQPGSHWQIKHACVRCIRHTYTLLKELDFQSLPCHFTKIILRPSGAKHFKTCIYDIHNFTCSYTI